MLGAVSSVIQKIQGKSNPLDKASNASAGSESLGEGPSDIALRPGEEAGDLTKKSGQGSHYQKPPHEEAEKDSSEIIGDALKEAKHFILNSNSIQEFQLALPKKKKKKDQDKPNFNIVDGESATRMDKIFRKTNKLIEKLKGSKSYNSGSQKKIKTNPDPKGNLIDKKSA